MRRLATRLVFGSGGFTLVEVMMAFWILVIGLFAVLVGLQTARKSTETSKQAQQTVAIAEREIDAVKGLRFTQVALLHNGDYPTHATSISNPNYWVNGSNLNIARDYNDSSSSGIADTFSGGNEPLVDGGGGGPVVPKSTVTGIGAQTFTVWRYVSYRREAALVDLDKVNVAGINLSVPLPALLCSPTTVSKRVTVAVLPTSTSQHAGPTKPVYASTVLVQPGVNLPLPLGGPLTC